MKNFEILPLQNIKKRFILYSIYLKDILNENIQLKFSKNIMEVLKIIENKYIENPIKQNERFLLRILGVLCHTQFIGPEWFHLDVSNPCNIDCNYCWFYSKYLKNPPSYEFKKSMINYRDFKNLVNDLARLSTDTILFTGAGEPFLHPKINDMIKFVKEKKIKLQIFTNGTIINEESAKTIIETETDELFISVSASNPITYVKVHPNQKEKLFFDSEKNIKRLIKLKKEKRKKNPNIVLLFVICRDNYNDVIEMADWAFKLGVDSIRYQLAHNGDASEVELLDKQKEFVREKILKVKKKFKGTSLHINPNIFFQLENTDKNNEWYESHYEKKGCYVGWFFSRLWADNKISFCCIKKEVEHFKHKNSFWSLWKSQKYDKYRNAARSFGKENILLTQNYFLIDKDCSHCGNYEINEKVFNFFEETGLKKYL